MAAAAVRARRGVWASRSQPNAAWMSSNDTEVNFFPVAVPRALSRGHSLSVRPQTPGPSAAPSFDESFNPQNALVVEGYQTGQAVAGLQYTKRRVVPPEPAELSAADAGGRTRQLAEVLGHERRQRGKDQATARRLRAEVERLTAVVAERDAEIGKTVNTIASLKDQLEVRSKEHHAHRVAIQEQLRRAQAAQALAEQRTALLLTQIEEARDQQASRECSAAERESELAKAAARLRAEILMLEDQLLAARREGDRRAEDHADAERRWAELLTAGRAEGDAHISTIRELEAEVEGQRHRAAAQADHCRRLQDQLTECHRYLQRICQPQFAVVNGKSLTPVDVNGFETVEGHVLVPLPILLEGFALLPESMRGVYNQTPYAPPTPAAAPMQGHPTAPSGRPTSSHGRRS